MQWSDGARSVRRSIVGVGLAGLLFTSPVTADLGQPVDPLVDSYVLQQNPEVTTSVAPVPIAVYGGLMLMGGMGVGRYVKKRRRG